MLSLALGALLIGALFAALQLQNSAKNLTKDQADSPRITLQAGALSALFIALAALAELLFTQTGNNIETLQRMLTNLAYYAALPLLATAMLVSVHNHHWERAAWGRWLIGLFALFELLRRMEQGELYTQVVAVTVSAAFLFTFLATKEKHLKKVTLIASINMAIALLLTGPGALLPNPISDNGYLYPLLLAGALPLSAIAIKQTVFFHHEKSLSN